MTQDFKAYQIALKEFFKVSKKNRVLPMQPSELFSRVGRKYVYLRNGTDVLGKYHLKKGIFV